MFTLFSFPVLRSATKTVLGLALLGLALAQVTLAQNPFGAQPAFVGQSSPNVINGSLTISRPGVYVLARSVRVESGDAITIASSGVTLDLNGFMLSTAAPGTGRGVFVNGVSNVEVKNGKIGSFRSAVMLTGATNVMVENLQITGNNLPPAADGPSEIGVHLINTRGAVIKGNTVTAMNLGIFVRGIGSTGNRITDNNLVGGATNANNLLGICYNPAPGADAATDGPRGDLVYNNLITRYGYAIAISEASLANTFKDNTLASFIGGIREPNTLTTNGGTNVAEGNTVVRIP